MTATYTQSHVMRARECLTGMITGHLGATLDPWEVVDFLFEHNYVADLLFEEVAGEMEEPA
jgi:hypothetical protein